MIVKQSCELCLSLTGSKIWYGTHTEQEHPPQEAWHGMHRNRLELSIAAPDEKGVWGPTWMSPAQLRTAEWRTAEWRTGVLPVMHTRR